MTADQNGFALRLPRREVAGMAEPWRQPWWPGNQLATRAPETCVALSPELAGPIVGASAVPHQTGDVPDRSECSVEGNGATVRVRYSVHSGVFNSGVKAAKAYLGSQLTDDVDISERPALGEEAVFQGKAPGSHSIFLGPSQLLAARKGNVVVLVTYTGTGDPATIRPAIGAEAVNAIRLS